MKNYVIGMDFGTLSVRALAVRLSDGAARGIDFTACSFFPVDEAFTPLCMKPAFENESHAYCKLWKHRRCFPPHTALSKPRTGCRIV